jgi:hypothetical protein
MARLGEILIEKGVLSLTELHTALETCHRTGARLGTQLLEFGYVEEAVLLDALSKQVDCPSVSRTKLLHSPVEVRRTLPVHIARRLQAVPFADAGTCVKVAMTNPNDRAAIEEIGTYVRKTLIPHVASEGAVLAAIGAAEAEDVDWPADADAEVAGRSDGEADGWNRLWEPPRLRPAELFRTTAARPSEQTVIMATFPDLSPVGARRGSMFEPTIDDRTFSELMYQTCHRDGIASILTRLGVSIYDRACLFSVNHGIVSGWMARGRSVVTEDLQSLSISLDEPSIFADVGHADSFIGPIRSEHANEDLIEALADPAPVEVVLVPIRVKQRLVAFLLCDDPGHPVAREPVDRLVNACRKAGIALEALVLRTKILS